MEQNKRIRGTNYTSEEKMLLLNLVNSYKSVLECKKTDTVSCQDKIRVWKEIEIKFNCKAPNNVHRNLDSLKKYYENMKKKTRKQASEEKMQTIMTGGGSRSIITDPTFDLTMSILNKKTVYGLEHVCDSDSVIQLSQPQPSRETTPSETVLVTGESEGLEATTLITLKQVPENIIDSEIQLSSEPGPSWKTYKPVDLQIPLSNSLKRKASEDSWTKRRRPTVTSLNSSRLSKQYSDLATVKLEVAELQKTFLNNEWQQKKQIEEKEGQLKLKLLQLEIDVKTAQLTRETEKIKLEKEILILELKIKEAQLKKLQSL